MQPLVTISIPLYKCEDFLEKCLDSVRGQSYKNIEVTLINDCTPDRSVEIAQEYISKYQLGDSWNILHLSENSGLSVVRNKGIDTARGKYLFFLDSDDTITPDCIEKMVELAEKEQVQLVIGEVEAVSLPKGDRWDIFPISEEKNVLYGNDEIFKSFIKGKFPVSSWNKLILLEFLRNAALKFIPGLYAQDSLHSFHMALKLQSIAFLRKKTYDYYLHDNSVIHNRGKKHFDNWQTIGEHIDAALRQEKDKNRRVLILEYLTKYKTTTLLMNWKAQKNEELWKESYRNYQKLSSLRAFDYLSSGYSKEIKIKAILISLPYQLGFKLFKWRYER